MSEPQPDFYLGSIETGPPIEPKKCFILERMQSDWGPELLRVQVVPPIVKAPAWQFVSDRLDELVLQARLSGQTIDPVSNWPLPVYICRIANDKIKGSGRAAARDIVVEYWGEIYPTLEDAVKSIAPWR